jgi:hypothetical protein
MWRPRRCGDTHVLSLDSKGQQAGPVGLFSVIDKNGGQVTVISEPGRESYPGVRRNGVQSGNGGKFKNSFRFAGAAPVSDCPDDYRALDAGSPPLACTCSAEATRRGNVYGMEIYSGLSTVCQAALHIKRRGPPR